MHTLELDNFKVTWIHYMPTDYYMKKELFPDTPDEVFKEIGFEKEIPSSYSVFLIDVNGTKILVDTGYPQPDTILLEKLKSINVLPEDINYIYISHIHRDHVGGLLNGDEVVFPNSTVYLGEKEYNGRFKFREVDRLRIEKIVDLYGSRLKFFKHGDILPCNVKTHDCSGHTPGLTIFEIGKVLICADMMHALALQKDHPEYCSIYDMDKEAAIEKRKYFINYAKQNGLYVYGSHFPYPGYYQP